MKNFFKTLLPMQQRLLAVITGILLLVIPEFIDRGGSEYKKLFVDSLELTAVYLIFLGIFKLDILKPIMSGTKMRYLPSFFIILTAVLSVLFIKMWIQSLFVH